MRDYLWCTSKLSFQARFPEIFDQILQNTPVLEFGSRTPPPPPEMKIFPESKSDLTQNTPLPPEMKFFPRVQNWPYTEHPFNWKLIFFPQSKTDLTQNTPPPPPRSGGWSMWRLMAVSPKDTISFDHVTRGTMQHNKNKITALHL